MTGITSTFESGAIKLYLLNSNSEGNNPNWLKFELDQDVILNLDICNSPVENQNDLELDFKVFFFADSCCAGIVFDESN